MHQRHTKYATGDQTNIGYLGQRSVETASYTVSQALQTPGLPYIWVATEKMKYLLVQSPGLRLRIDRVESMNLSEKVTAFLCKISNATEQPVSK